MVFALFLKKNNTYIMKNKGKILDIPLSRSGKNRIIEPFKYYLVNEYDSLDIDTYDGCGSTFI